jgi:anion-transporting  ArsA/GET3 family ATPase
VQCTATSRRGRHYAFHTDMIVRSTNHCSWGRRLSQIQQTSLFCFENGMNNGTDRLSDGLTHSFWYGISNFDAFLVCGEKNHKQKTNKQTNKQMTNPPVVMNEPQRLLEELHRKYRSLSETMQKVASFPAKVSYAQVLVPETKVSFQYMTLVHTNEFKLLSDSNDDGDSGGDDQSERLSRTAFMSYVEAGEALQLRQHALVKQIVDTQRLHHLPPTKFDMVTTRPASMTPFQATTLPATSATTASITSKTPPPTTTQSTKHPVAKPQVFEIREYISENGVSTSHEVVDITKQLEFMESMAAADQSDGAVKFNVRNCKSTCCYQLLKN